MISDTINSVDRILTNANKDSIRFKISDALMILLIQELKEIKRDLREL